LLGYGLTAGEYAGSDTAFACRLHGALAAQGGQTGCGTSELTQRERHIDDRHYVVGAVLMLRKTHAPGEYDVTRAGHLAGGGGHDVARNAALHFEVVESLLGECTG